MENNKAGCRWIRFIPESSQKYLEKCLIYRRYGYFKLTYELTYPLENLQIKQKISGNTIFSSITLFFAKWKLKYQRIHWIRAFQAQKNPRRAFSSRVSSWATRIRTLRWRSQSPLPYRLAIAQCWLLLIVYMIILYLASYFFKFFY